MLKIQNIIDIKFEKYLIHKERDEENEKKIISSITNNYVDS